MAWTMLCGLDLLLDERGERALRRIRSASFALLTHEPSVDRRGKTCLGVLDELGAHARVVFTPEHGFSANAQAMVPVASVGGASNGNRKFVSLYGESRDSLAPRAEDLSGIELLVVDLCDVGSRYYTYLWTAVLAARAAAGAGIHTLILDRPNPISGDPATVEGRPQERAYCSFVGLEPLAIRHSMTLGEVVAGLLEAGGHELGPSGALSIVPTRGWERLRTAQGWRRPFVPPSPNMPTVETALVYPGACLLEGTNLSEGRGTTVPFQVAGAPFLDSGALAAALDERRILGALVRPVSFTPTSDKYAGELCHGVMLHVTDAALFRPVAAYLTLIALASRQAPADFRFRRDPYEFESSIPAFDLLTGSSAAREAIEAQADVEQVIELVSPVPDELKTEVYSFEARARAAIA